MLKTLALLLAGLTISTVGFAREGAIDTADPARVYSGFGLAASTSDYDNGDSRRELRGSLSWALTDSDMLQVESGYGRHESAGSGDVDELTRTRLLYRQRLPFDDSRPQGFLGMAFQYSLTLSGELKGTDGQTILAGGAVPAIRISESFNLYPVVDVINCFSKNFKNYNGLGMDFAPILSYNPGYLWPGAALQIEPGFTQYLVGQLAFGNSRNLKVTCAGTLFTVLNWSLSAEKHYGRDLLTYRGAKSSGLKHDWSASFQLLATF